MLAIHAEGSLEAQKLTGLMDADLAPYKAYARRLAGIAQRVRVVGPGGIAGYRAYARRLAGIA